MVFTLVVSMYFEIINKNIMKTNVVLIRTDITNSDTLNCLKSHKLFRTSKDNLHVT